MDNYENQIIDESNKKEEFKRTLRDLQAMLKAGNQLLSMHKETWETIQKDFNINESHCIKLLEYNDSIRNKPIDESVDTTDIIFSTLDNINKDKIDEIFDKETNIRGVELGHTISRIKIAAESYYTYTTIKKNLATFTDEYRQLLENQEKLQIQMLQDAYDKEEDVDKKLKISLLIKDIIDHKTLSFLSEKLPDKYIDIIVNKYHDRQQLRYIIGRAKSILEKVEISTNIIFTLSNFEKFILDKKYHRQDGLLLIHFLHEAVYKDINNPNNRRKLAAMVIALNSLIANKSCEYSDEMMKNIIAFEDQFIGKIN